MCVTHHRSCTLSSSGFGGRLLSLFGEPSFSLAAAADNDEEGDKDVIFPFMMSRLLNIKKPWKKMKCSLSLAHTTTHWLFTKCLAGGRSKINRVKEEVAPTRGHMTQRTGSDTKNYLSWVTSGTVVNDGLVLRVCRVCTFVSFTIIWSVWGLSTFLPDLWLCS